VKVTVHFKQLNPEYSKQVADEYFEGEENDFNFRFLWEDELEVSEPVRDFAVSNNSTYPLQGEFPNGKAFSFEIPQMMLLQLNTESGNQVALGASKKLVKRSDKQLLDNGDLEFTFFLKGNKEFQNPFPGLFILDEDFPEELPKEVVSSE